MLETGGGEREGCRRVVEGLAFGNTLLIFIWIRIQNFGS